MLKLARRVDAISGSPTARMVKLKNQFKAEGKKIYDFGAGEPDFPTPPHIKEAGVSAIRSDFTRYTAADGIPELKEAIRETYLQEQGVEPSDAEIVVSPGSKFGLFALLQTLIEEGDDAILPRPYWVSYPEMVRFCGGRTVFADHLSSDPLFEITADSYIRQATDRTRAVIINSPANPTGKIMEKKELLKLIDFFFPRRVMVIIDDCYRHIRFHDTSYPSAWQLRPEAKEYIAVASSLSKSFSMTGWRIGYTIADARVSAAMIKIYEHSVSNTCSITQKAAVEALRGDKQFLAVMVEEYRRRRDFIAGRMDAIGRIRYVLPDGAFYLFADFSHYLGEKRLADDESLAMELLNHLSIITVPGSAFGAPGYLRFSFAASMEDIRDGLDQLESWLQK